MAKLTKKEKRARARLSKSVDRVLKIGNYREEVLPMKLKRTSPTKILVADKLGGRPLSRDMRAYSS